VVFVLVCYSSAKVCTDMCGSCDVACLQPCNTDLHGLKAFADHGYYCSGASPASVFMLDIVK
jgi:hypothetical protein